MDPNRPSLEDQKHIASFLWQDNFERAWGQSSLGVGWTCAPKGGNALASCSAPLERRAFLPHSAHVPRSLEVTLRSGRVNEVLTASSANQTSGAHRKMGAFGSVVVIPPPKGSNKGHWRSKPNLPGTLQKLQPPAGPSLLRHFNRIARTRSQHSPDTTNNKLIALAFPGWGVSYNVNFSHSIAT